MPSQILHSLFGEDLYGEILDTLHSPLNGPHKRAFCLGCQGPDIFYHSQGRRPVGLGYGTLIHRRGAGSFSAALLGGSLEASGEKMSALAAYALGFLSHIFLDRQVHPYIVYKSALIPNFPRSHAFFERIVDTLMLKILRNQEPCDWDQEGLLAEPCRNPPEGLKELLAGTLIQVYPERAGKDHKLMERLDNAFLDSAGFYRNTAPALRTMNRPGHGGLEPGGIKKRHLALIHPEKLPQHIDFLNMEKRPWYHPAGEGAEETRSLPEIYAGAVKAAKDTLGPLLLLWLEGGTFPVLKAAGAIGDGGLSIVDENGLPSRPLRLEPLPLEEVLEEQARLWNP